MRGDLLAVGHGAFPTRPCHEGQRLQFIRDGDRNVRGELFLRMGLYAHEGQGRQYENETLNGSLLGVCDHNLADEFTVHHVLIGFVRISQFERLVDHGLGAGGVHGFEQVLEHAPAARGDTLHSQVFEQ